MSSTLLRSVINLTKNLIGAGMLSVPLAISLIGNLYASSLVLLIACILNGLSFLMLGACCRWTGEKTYRGISDRLLGRKFGFLVDATILINSFLACVALVVLLGDFITTTGLLDISRESVIGVTGVLMILPLCYLKSLAGLAFSSMLGLVAILYIFVYISMDAWSKPDQIENGDIWSVGSVLKSWTLLTPCFLAHYNAPRFHAELRHPTATRFSTLVISVFALCLLVYGVFGYAGYRIFGKSVRGDVLDSYTKTNGYLVAGKLAMGFSVTFTYPLVFAALKEVLSKYIRSDRYMNISISIVVILTMMLGSYVPDVSKFNALKGATSSCVLSFILPPLMYLRARTEASRTLLSREFVLSRAVPLTVLSVGTGLGVLSVVDLMIS